MSNFLAFIVMKIFPWHYDMSKNSDHMPVFLQFQTKMHPVDHVKSTQWMSTSREQNSFFLKGSVSEQEKRCLQMGARVFWKQRPIKDKFFYSVL